MEKVGEIKIDFDIFSKKTTHIIIGDTSDWVYAENKPAYIEITLPGSKKKKTFVYNKHNFNTYNSHNLGISCFTNDCKEEVYLDLPDGIYTICVKSSFEDIEKESFYLKTDLFEREYHKTLVKYGLEYNRDSEFLTYMVKIQGILLVAKAHAYEGDFAKAQNFFIEARDMLNKYNV